MSTEQIIEGNKLIAEFMGYKKDSAIRFSKSWLRELEYHASWDWLMPVYYEIGGVNELPKYPNLPYLRDKHPMFHQMHSFWEQAVEFIKWYNKEQNVQECDATEDDSSNTGEAQK